MELGPISEALQIVTVKEAENVGEFEIGGLYAGYGLTMGNALRRALLSSIQGAAITSAKIKGVGHEFSTIPNIVEDVVEIAINLKRVRFAMYTDEPQILTVHVKGEEKVTASAIEENAQVSVISKDAHIATLTTKGAELDMELTVERGLGYVPVEARKSEKLPIGVVALDAFFSPVTKVNFVVENMRVGDRTDYNKLRFMIETDGSISPSAALRRAAEILQGHFEKVATVEVKEAPKPESGESAKKAKKQKSKKE